MGVYDNSIYGIYDVHKCDEIRKMKWLIFIIILVIILMQPEIKKESNFRFRCSEDTKSVQIYNKNTMEFIDYQVCENECKVINNIPICIQSEIRKEAPAISFPLLATGIVLLIIGYRRLNKNG